ncbi:MAG: response regulator [Candidatus Aminicenantes bacterium]|nr:response regulator [Candidatus Aminicenantes bacterium]
MNDKTRVLIVDDDPEVLKSLQLWLKSEGFKAFTAGDEEQARSIIQKEEIAVGLVDLHLKNTDGLRLASALQSLDDLLRIIVITGYPTYESAIDAMKTGIFDYISKSTENEAILGKIRAAVQDRERQLARRRQSGEDRSGIVLLGHHQLVREGLENFFRENPGYRLLHTYPSWEYIKKSDFNLEAALLLVCSSCNQEAMRDGEKFFGRIKILFPNAKVVCINCDCGDERKKELLRHGVKGFLPPSISRANLKKALDGILGGQIWVSRELSHRLLSELLEDARPQYERPAEQFGLTPREIEILKALASGLTNCAISEILFLSEKTIKTHIHHIFRKMEVKTRTQAVMKAMEFHLI